jgi:hypothetical protein
MSAPCNFLSATVSRCEVGRTLVRPAHGQTKVRPNSSEEELDNALFNQQK